MLRLKVLLAIFEGWGQGCFHKEELSLLRGQEGPCWEAGRWAQDPHGHSWALYLVISGLLS